MSQILSVRHAIAGEVRLGFARTCLDTVEFSINNRIFQMSDFRPDDGELVRSNVFL